MRCDYIYDENAILKDRWRSFLNKTHIREQEAENVVKYIMHKYKLDVADALKKLNNLYIDKKIQLKRIDKDAINSITVVNTITNLKQL